jgi:GMP synthase-like glutamine amidotransferase
MKEVPVGISIGILLTNPDRSAARLEFPNDGEQVRTLLAAERPEYIQRVYDCVAGELPESPNAHDGYVITGSPASVNEGSKWVADLLEFLRALDAVRRPTVGLCFGHQAIVSALGGSVTQGSWDFGVTQLDFTSSQEWMTPAHNSLQLYSAHHEQVTKLPDGFSVIGGNEFCPNASLLKGTHIFTTQYHPEMTPDFMMTLTDWLKDDLGADAISKARRDIGGDTQGPVFAQWMANFFELKRD